MVLAVLSCWKNRQRQRTKGITPISFGVRPVKNRGGGIIAQRCPELRTIFNKRKITKSLETSSEKETKRRYHRISLDVEEMIRDARNGTPTKTLYSRLKRKRNSAFNKAKCDPETYFEDKVDFIEQGRCKDGREYARVTLEPETATLEEAFLVTENKKPRAKIAQLRQEKPLGIGDGRETEAQIEA